MLRLPLALTLFLVLATAPQHVHGQDRVNVSLGVGLPDLLHVGAYYQLHQVQIGLTLGAVPLLERETFVSASGDFYYHFSGSSDLAGRNVWFVKSSASYWRSGMPTHTDHYVHQSFNLGRDVNLSSHVGLAISAGVMVSVFTHRAKKQEPVFPTVIDPDVRTPAVFPSFALRLFYRL